MCMNTEDINSDLSKKSPRAPYYIRVCDAATPPPPQKKKTLLPVKNAKVVMTCTLNKHNYQFGTFQVFIK